MGGLKLDRNSFDTQVFLFLPLQNLVARPRIAPFPLLPPVLLFLVVNKEPKKISKPHRGSVLKAKVTRLETMGPNHF